MKTVILLLGVALTTLVAGQDLGTHSPSATWDETYGSLIVVHADMPLYPWLAIAARQSGTVRVRVSIKEGVVVNATAEASAPPVLVHAAKENALTWRFAHDATSTLTVTYIYELAKDESGVLQNPHIEMQLPTLVKITARPVYAFRMDDK
jgi:outer membrane biosynthesis protein TonB